MSCVAGDHCCFPGEQQLLDTPVLPPAAYLELQTVLGCCKSSEAHPKQQPDGVGLLFGMDAACQPATLRAGPSVAADPAARLLAGHQRSDLILISTGSRRTVR